MAFKEIAGFKIVQEISSKGKTLVYRAIRESDQHPVILKILNVEYPSPAEIARYEHEYQILMKLDVAGVPRPIGLEKIGNSILMLVDGSGNFSSLKFSLEKKPFPWIEAFQIALKISKTLDGIHQGGIIHKDIKPHNILFDAQTEEVQIIDFGVSSFLSTEEQQAVSPNGLDGTIHYIAPEQTGRMNRSVDYRCDYYSLGATLYEMITGKLPFAGDDAMAVIHAHISQNPKPLHECTSGVPEVVSQIILKLMSKNAEDRYQSAAGLQADINRCIEQAKTQPELQSFPLGQDDFIAKLQIPEKLYGRSKEIAQLLEAYARASQSQSELVLVAGYSGIGKSALIHEVHKPIAKNRGQFIQGKFDQFKRNIPYSAVIQAFQGFVKQLQTESEDTLKQWKSKILLALGVNAQVLIDVIPELGSLLGPQPSVPTLSPAEAQVRFNLTFQSFLNAIATKDHPLVLFLDDMQWSDAPTIELMTTVLSDKDRKHFLFIAAYRDNEVDETHPLILALQHMKKSNVHVEKIVLQPFKDTHITELLCDALKTTKEKVHALTQLILQKTGGNPFFMTQFLSTLHHEKILTFSSTEKCWTWNLGAIQSLGLSNNVVDLMVRKLGKLPEETKNALKLAACIGNTFDLKTLALVAQKSVVQISKDLWPAVVEGYLIPIGDDHELLKESDEKRAKELINSQEVKEKFLHDRVQQAAYAMIKSDEATSIHLNVGRLLLKSTPQNSIEEEVFDLVSQFNKATTLLADPEERLKVAELNTIAAHKAKTANAYEPALEFIETAIELLPQDAWASQYELTLKTYTEATEIAYLCGKIDLLEQYKEIVLKNAKSVLDKTTVYEISMNCYSALGRMDDTVNSAFAALELLGIHIPKKCAKIRVVATLLYCKFLQGSRSPEDLSSLPEMTDPQKIAAIRILKSTVPAAYVAAPTSFPIVVLTMVILSIKHGNCGISGFAYTLYGMVHCGVLGKMDEGYRLGQVGLKVSQHFNARDILPGNACPANYFTHAWSKPLRKGIEPLRKAAEDSREVGNLEMLGWSTSFGLIFEFLCGNPLADTLKKFEQTFEIYNKLKIFGPPYVSRPFGELVRALQNDNPQNHSINLEGSFFSYEKGLPEVEKIPHIEGIFCSRVAQAIWDYFNGNFESALKNLEASMQFIEPLLANPVIPLHHFYYSLSLIAVAQKRDPGERKPLLKQVRKNQKKMQTWSKHAPMNYLHKFYLVEAELAALEGKNQIAENFYDLSIQEAKKNEFLHEEALANERAALFWLNCKKERIAKLFMTEAKYLYSRWGATAKANSIAEKHPDLLFTTNAASNDADLSVTATTMGTVAFSTSTATGASILDMGSVLKSSQAVAGEIHLDSLLKKLTSILAENAGAERGVIVLRQNNIDDTDTDIEQFRIQASLSSKGEIQVMQALPLEQSQECSHAILRYVARTKQLVVLDNAASTGDFTQEAYIQKHGIRSVFCMPIVNQQRLVGILYFENNLATNSFTSNRIGILQMLSSQIAVALENALLYSSLEEKVIERTRQLAEKTREVSTMFDALEQGVCTIDQNLQLQGQYSKHLEQIVHQSSLQQKPVLDYLFSNSAVSTDQVNQIHEALKSCIGESPLNWELNSHLLKNEITRKHEGSDQFLRMEWKPIESDEGTISKVMLVVRDESHLKKLQKEALDKQKQLNLVEALLNLSPEEFQAFHSRCNELIQDTNSHLQSIKDKNAALSSDVITQLFRNLHTIKGNSRIYGFESISEAAHLAEQEYAQARENPQYGISYEKLLKDLAAVENALRQIHEFYSVKISKHLINTNKPTKSPGAIVTTQVQQEKFSLLIQPVLKSIPSIAAETKVEPPRIQVKESTDACLPKSCQNLLSDVFSHLIRNALSHGIEGKEERILKGKSPIGCISIETTLTDMDKLCIQLQDDGRGLNLNYLEKIAHAKGKKMPSANRDEFLANTIFESGVSTAQKVTQISGRGVGMDAVREFLKELGATIEVKFIDPKRSNEGFRRFSFVIQIPTTRQEEKKAA